MDSFTDQYVRRWELNDVQPINDHKTPMPLFGIKITSMFTIYHHFPHNILTLWTVADSTAKACDQGATTSCHTVRDCSSTVFVYGLRLGLIEILWSPVLLSKWMVLDYMRKNVVSHFVMIRGLQPEVLLGGLGLYAVSMVTASHLLLGTGSAEMIYARVF